MSQSFKIHFAEQASDTNSPSSLNGGVRVTSLLRIGAEDEAQTRDPQLGRLMLYQLSYFRKNRPYQSYPLPHTVSRRRRARNSNRHSFLWEVMDSNHRRRTPADLQSAPFGHSGNFPLFCSSPVRKSLRSSFPEELARFTRLRLVPLRRSRFGEAFVLPAPGRCFRYKSFFETSPSEKPCLRQASLCRQSFSSVPLTRFCNFISLPSRRLSEPMEGVRTPDQLITNRAALAN